MVCSYLNIQGHRNYSKKIEINNDNLKTLELTWPLIMISTNFQAIKDARQHDSSSQRQFEPIVLGSGSIKYVIT